MKSIEICRFNSLPRLTEIKTNVNKSLLEQSGGHLGRIEMSIESIASKTCGIGLIIGSFTLSDLSLLIGIMVTLGSFIILLYKTGKENKRRDRELEIRELELKKLLEDEDEDYK